MINKILFAGIIKPAVDSLAVKKKIVTAVKEAVLVRIMNKYRDFLCVRRIVICGVNPDIQHVPAVVKHLQAVNTQVIRIYAG